MIKVIDIHTLANLKDKVIEFTKRIEDWECYADPHMRARVTGYRYNPDGDTDPDQIIHEVFFDFSEFAEYNKRYEQNNYWDKNGNPTLTAREAGCYTLKESIWFGEKLPIVEVE